MRPQEPVAFTFYGPQLGSSFRHRHQHIASVTKKGAQRKETRDINSKNETNITFTASKTVHFGQKLSDHPAADPS